MGGKPTVRGMRVTVGMVASGRTADEILELYPYLESKDIQAALKYAAWQVKEMDFPVFP